VLRFAYNFDARQITDALTKLLGLPTVHINHPSLVAQAITWHLQGLDFADAFHLANSRQCKTFFTFDKKMINAAKNIDTCEVLAP
jgi:predicted nucleic acid-binding protein